MRITERANRGREEKRFGLTIYVNFGGLVGGSGGKWLFAFAHVRRRSSQLFRCLRQLLLADGKCNLVVTFLSRISRRCAMTSTIYDMVIRSEPKERAENRNRNTERCYDDLRHEQKIYEIKNRTMKKYFVWEKSVHAFMRGIRAREGQE